MTDSCISFADMAVGANGITAFSCTQERMSLDAAFRRVFQARNYIRPNPGFWQQARSCQAQVQQAYIVAT